MSYKLTCLAFTRRDPGTRGFIAADARTGITLGLKKIPPAQTIVVSDAFYDQHKHAVQKYITAGFLEVVYKEDPVVNYAQVIDPPPAPQSTVPVTPLVMMPGPGKLPTITQVDPVIVDKSTWVSVVEPAPEPVITDNNDEPVIAATSVIPVPAPALEMPQLVEPGLKKAGRKPRAQVE